MQRLRRRCQALRDRRALPWAGRDRSACRIDL